MLTVNFTKLEHHLQNLKNSANAVVCIGMIVALAGCATNAPGGVQQARAGTSDPCNVAGSAIAGALVGALIGGLSGNRTTALKGAAIGGALGAASCVAINVQSRQTKTAVQAEQDFRNLHPVVPSEPTLVFYDPRLSAGVVRRGQPFMVESALELVNGTDVLVREIREEIVVYDAGGKAINSGSKPFVASTAGRFENSFEIKLPTNAPQGVYSMQTRLYVNGKLAATRDLRSQVVRNGADVVLIALR